MSHVVCLLWATLLIKVVALQNSAHSDQVTALFQLGVTTTSQPQTVCSFNVLMSSERSDGIQLEYILRILIPII